MKYMVILDESQFKDFNINTTKPFAIHLTDKNGEDRLLSYRPIIKPMVVIPTGESVYITQGHIDALTEYECNEQIKELCERMNHSIDGIKDVDLPSNIPLLTPEDIKRQLGIVSPSEHAAKQYYVNPDELKEALQKGIDGTDNN